MILETTFNAAHLVLIIYYHTNVMML